MTGPSYVPRPRWWQRRGPSVLVFCVVIAAMGLASLALWGRLTDVLPEVGKDKQGEDPWTDPLGVEKLGDFQVVRIPDCAAAPVVRVELWDEDSEPYWEMTGPPTPLQSFVVGVAPEGWEEQTPYREPPAGAVLRLLVVRRVKGVAGVRFQARDLRSEYVTTGPPTTRYLVEDFVTGSVCGDEDEADPEQAGEGGTTTTEPTGG